MAEVFEYEKFPFSGNVIIFLFSLSFSSFNFFIGISQRQIRDSGNFSSKNRDAFSVFQSESFSIGSIHFFSPLIASFIELKREQV